MDDKKNNGRSAISLGGGGVTGVMFQVGALAALEEAFGGFSAADFDVFIASSSSATLAAALAGGFPATRIYRALLDPADDFFPLKRSHLLRLDAWEWRRVMKSSFGAFRHLLSSAASNPLELDVWDELDRFWDSLPSGIFALDPYERFLESFFKRRGIPQNMGEIERTLLIVASDLDRGERVVFGKGGEEDVSLAKAICAASAVPLLFAPVRINDRDCTDAGMGDVAHIDLAVEHGCDLSLIINPMVPIQTDLSEKGIPTGHGRKRRVRNKGLIWVGSQAARLRHEAHLRRGLLRYEKAHPEHTLFLLEPAAGDTTMFLYSPMNFSARRAILEHGFQQMQRRLNDPEDLLRPTLEGRLSESP